MLVAYLCREGRQPLSEVLRLTRPDAIDFANAISRWVGRGDPLMGD